ncbi:MAG: transglutaminase-like domain-containing protein [Bryobacterales bacterium]|nr:transglutaminase-like domain-containing protein [Bryobacterales bacterium]
MSLPEPIVDVLKNMLRLPDVDGPAALAPRTDCVLNALETLDRAALEIVHLESPGFDCQPYLHQLDAWAAELRQGPIDRLAGYSFVREFHSFFFDHLGFHGNADDYFNPANSFLNEVMDRRTGIPITLSVVYMELARRLGRTVHGIGFPGHFLVRVDDVGFREYVDVFHRGRLLSSADCFAMGVEMTGIDYAERPAVLDPVNARTILVRMLNNLRGIYITRKANRKLLQVLDLLLLADPGNAQEYFARAMAKMNLHLYSGAERDLLRFLQLTPDNNLKKAVQHQLELARMMRSQLN